MIITDTVVDVSKSVACTCTCAS